MECTQRLECTQQLNETHTERICPEQVGFLGICGKTYPVIHGPNKIGRDPQTCNIVLNLNSISRQHAVINILNKTDFMLMDLDSANKTKLLNKTLQAYIPQPLKNGDTVQFGEVFGIFRLLEEDDDLPMTQAIDVPETPVFSKHKSRLNNAPITTVPESPDVSDRDDSFIIASQPKDKQFKSSNNHNFVRPVSKTISIQPIGSNKIDNVFWNSSKKSTSLQLNDSSSNLNDSVLNSKPGKTVAATNKDIFDMETQPSHPDKHIFEMETQPPPPDKHNESTDSIYTADTQIPGPQDSPSIHSLETQLPVPPTEHLPEVRKIHNQQEMHFDLYLANKENDNSIFNAETQMFPMGNKKLLKMNTARPDNDGSTSKEKSNVSDEEVLFDEVDNDFLEEDFGSQALLPQETSPKIIADDDILIEKTINKSLETQPKKRVVRLKSDSSTDCEDFDMALTQKIPEKKVGDEDDLTDCEEDFIEINAAKSKNLNESTKSNVEVDLEDIATQVIAVVESNAPPGVDLEDMPTQVIEVEKNDKDVVVVNKNLTKDDFVDLCTQDEYVPSNPDVKDAEQFSEEIISPFKIPYQSPIKVRRKDIIKVTPKPTVTKNTPKADDDNYYANTQDLFEDLDSQRALSPEIVPKQRQRPKGKRPIVKDNLDDEILPSSVENYKVGDKFPHLENQLSPEKFVRANKSSSSSDGDDKVQKFVSNLSSQQVREVIGVAKMRKLPSDCSDVDVTPKKVRPFKLMDIELPDSQEIKTSVTLKTHSLVTESSSESEVENNSEEQNTPILYKRKKKSKPDVKMDLTKKFDVAALPSRIITRVRKPTAKFQNSDEDSKIKSNLLKPKYLTEQEDNVDNEIINENLSRLRKHDKSKSDKVKISEDKKDLKVKEIKLECEKKANLTTETDKEKTSKEKEKKETRNEKDNKKAETLKMDSFVKTTKKESKQIKGDIIDSVDNISKNENIQEESVLKTNETIEREENISSSSSRRSMRSTRVKQKNEKKSKSPEKDVSKKEKTESKPKRTYKKKEKKRDPSPVEDTEVRRSKRQRVVKEKKVEPIHIKIKSILKNSLTAHEQSTDYNISSGSGSDSPKGIKRSVADDSAVPSPKRTRSMVTSNTSLRATPARTARTQYVLFTAFPSDEVKMKLENLGAVIVTDVTACTVVLTIQIKRTFKLLCAVGLGKPIVGPSWVQACADTNTIVDPWLYLIKDEVAEKRFKFSLESTLRGKRNFLSGYNVFSTPSVLPNPTEMKLIVECSGGTWKDEGPRWVCVSSTADKGLWPLLRRRGATIVSTEFILGGVLKQKLDIYGNKF